MKKTVTYLVLFVMVTMFFASVNMSSLVASAATDEQIFVYNWGDYIDPDVGKDFETYYKAKTGKSIQLVYSTFDTNEIMLTTMLKGKDKIDLICPSEYAIERLMRAGKLEKLDLNKIGNYANVEQEIVEKVDEVFPSIEINGKSSNMSEYFVPYMWGTLGILYNTKYATREQAEAAGYGLLWNSSNIEAINDKIMLKDSIRDVYVAGVMRLRELDRLPVKYKETPVQELINTVDFDLLDAVEMVLKEQKSVLKEYEVDFGKGDIMAERAYVDLAWSGDALWAMEENENLDYYVPEVGGNVWFDGWVMPSNAPNKNAAYEFINFMCQPDIAIRNSIYIGYTSALSCEALQADEAAINLLIENEYDVTEYFEDTNRYPAISSPNLAVMKDFAEMNDPVVSMWERVKAQSNIWVLFVIVGVMVVLAGGAVLAFYIKTHKGGKILVAKAPPKE